MIKFTKLQGNGIRCLVRYVIDESYIARASTVETR